MLRKIKNERWIVMEFDDDKDPIRAKQIGKGRFTTAFYSPRTEKVYLFLKDGEDGDASKEILSHLHSTNKHIPQTEFFDTTPDGRIYTQPLYRPLTAANQVAWKQFKQLQKAYEEIAIKFNRDMSVFTRNSREWLYRCNETMQTLIDLVEDSDLREALETLLYATQNYGGSWMFEFAKRNLAVDEKGNLILLDAIFNREILLRQTENKKIRRSVYGR